MTIVVVSHDLASLYVIAEHVLVLQNGGVAFNGPLADLLATRETYLRRFLDRQAEETPAGESAVLALAPKVKAALDAWQGR